MLDDNKQEKKEKKIENYPKYCKTECYNFESFCQDYAGLIESELIILVNGLLNQGFQDIFGMSPEIPSLELSGECVKLEKGCWYIASWKVLDSVPSHKCHKVISCSYGQGQGDGIQLDSYVEQNNYVWDIFKNEKAGNAENRKVIEQRAIKLKESQEFDRVRKETVEREKERRHSENLARIGKIWDSLPANAGIYGQSYFAKKGLSEKESTPFDNIRYLHNAYYGNLAFGCFPANDRLVKIIDVTKLKKGTVILCKGTHLDGKIFYQELWPESIEIEDENLDKKPQNKNIIGYKKSGFVELTGFPLVLNPSFSFSLNVVIAEGVATSLSCYDSLVDLGLLSNTWLLAAIDCQNIDDVIATIKEILQKKGISLDNVNLLICADDDLHNQHKHNKDDTKKTGNTGIDGAVKACSLFPNAKYITPDFYLSGIERESFDDATIKANYTDFNDILQLPRGREIITKQLQILQNWHKYILGDPSNGLTKASCVIVCLDYWQFNQAYKAISTQSAKGYSLHAHYNAIVVYTHNQDLEANCNKLLKEYGEVAFLICGNSQTKKTLKKSLVTIQNFNDVPTLQSNLENALQLLSNLFPIGIKQPIPAILQKIFEDNFKINLLSSGTGTGKSYGFAYQAVNLCLCDKDAIAVIAVASITEINIVYNYCKEIIKTITLNANSLTIAKAEDLQISKVTSKHASLDNAGETGETDFLAIEQKLNANIIITSHAYFLRKGQSLAIFKQGDKMTKDVYLFVDECQDFVKSMFFELALAQNYRFLGDKKEGHYKAFDACQACHKGGNCQDCYRHYKQIKTEKVTGIPNYQYHKTLPKETVGTKKAGETPEAGLIADIGLLDTLNIGRYKKLMGHVFFAKLNQANPSKTTLLEALRYAQNTKGDEDATTTIKGILQTLLYPQIRLELPYYKTSGLPISPCNIIAQNLQTSKDIAWPKHACLIPIIKGIDILPLALLFTNCKQVTFASATIPSSLVRAVNYVANILGYQVNATKCDEIPFTFNVSMLATTKPIGLDVMEDVLYSLITSSDKAKIFIICKNKREMEALHKTLVNNSDRPEFSQKVSRFEGNNFENTPLADFSEKKEINTSQESPILLTYSRSNICQGQNLPNYEIAIVDCQQHLPQIALGIDIDSENLTEVMLTDISDNIEQISGRLLRSNLPRIPSQTVQDDKPLIYILYNVPSELAGKLTINKELTHKATYITDKDNWLPSDNKKIAMAINDAILARRQGQTPKNWQDEAQKDAIQKAGDKTSKGITQNLSHAQRTLINQSQLDEIKQTRKEERRQETLANKLQVLTQKVKQLKKEGKSWKEISISLNLAKYPEIRDNLKQGFDKNA